MTSPFALVFSIAGTVCGFALALVVVAGQASIAPTSTRGGSMAPKSVAAVA